MRFADLFARLKLSQKDAEVIFDRDEPVGAPTDLVMPHCHWLRRKNRKPNESAKRAPQRHALPS